MAMRRTIDTAAVVWIEGIQRHLADLRHNGYEGSTGKDREAVYAIAFELLSPVATGVLEEISATLLKGVGTVSVEPPHSDGADGLVGSWALRWPGLSTARSRYKGDPLSPVTISAIFPAGFTHPHLVAGGAIAGRPDSLTAWPMQVVSKEDAEHQRPVLWAIATAELHDRIYQSSWRIVSG